MHDLWVSCMCVRARKSPSTQPQNDFFYLSFYLFLMITDRRDQSDSLRYLCRGTGAINRTVGVWQSDDIGAFWSGTVDWPGTGKDSLAWREVISTTAEWWMALPHLCVLVPHVAFLVCNDVYSPGTYGVDCSKDFRIIYEEKAREKNVRKLFLLRRNSIFDIFSPFLFLFLIFFCFIWFLFWWTGWIYTDLRIYLSTGMHA